MKRIKYEEIQNSIQNYARQRNLSNNIVFSNNDIEIVGKKSKSNTSISNQFMVKKQSQKQQTFNSNFDDIQMMALNDLVLIESSINDYYSFTFSTSTEQEFISQYEIIKKFIKNASKKKNSNEMEQLLFPLFVYMCIDMTLIGFSIKEAIKKFKDDLIINEMNSEKIDLLEDLLLFNETKDLTKCRLVNNWTENKCHIKLNSKNWSKLLYFLQNSNTHLFLRIINLNLQITENNTNGLDENEEDQMETNDFEFNLNKEKIDFDSTIDKTKSAESEKFSNETKRSSNFISLKSLTECVDKINDEPSRINGACCYYINDLQDCITSANISPNTEMLSFTNENSSIFLFKLNEVNGHEIKNEIFNKSKPKSTGSFYYELNGGHLNSVFKSKFTHDSKYLLSCGSDNVACLWDVNKQINFNSNESKTSNKISESDEENEKIGEEMFETKLKSIYSGSLEEEKSATPSLVCTYSGHLYPVWDVELFSQLNLFVTSSKDTTARLWSFEHIYPLRIYCGHQSDVNCVQFHPNGAYLATGSSDKTVRLWSVQTGEFVRLFSGHRSRVFAIAFSPDGSYLASSGEDKKIKIWDLRSGLLLKEFKGHTDSVYSLCFDNQSEILCSGGSDKTVKFWDLHQKNIKIGPDFLKKDSNCLNHSNEIITSIYVDFNINSIYCDIQNVFYLNGAKKPSNKTTTNVIIKPSEIFKKDVKQVKLENELKIESGTNFSYKNQNSKSKNFNQNLNTTNLNNGSICKSTINTRRRTAAAASASAEIGNIQRNSMASKYSLDSTNYLFNNSNT